MSTAIYQKYRPQTFAEVIGQDYVKKILLNSFKNSTFGHAYLFSGPRGTGKTSIARLIAKAVNCENPKDGDVCNKCTSCKLVQSGQFIDLIEIDAASNRGIDEIRQLREKVNFAPAEGKKKVYIIDEVHMLTKEAFNALLKTLEEPPEFVVFVMATTEPHKILPTILSRVQRFDLKLANKDELVNKLERIAKEEGVEVTKEALDKVYELSGGSYRDSESILAKVLNIEVKKDKKVDVSDLEDSIGLVSSEKVLDFLNLVIEGKGAEAIEFLNGLVQDGYAVDQLMHQSLFLLRKKIRAVYAGDSSEDLRNLVMIISNFSEAMSKLRDAVIPTLPIEIAILNLTDQNISTIDKPQPKVVKNEVKIVKNTLTNNKKVSKNAQKDVRKDVESKEVGGKGGQGVKQESVEKEGVVAKDDSDVAISLEEVQNKWEEIVSKIKEHNHHLCAFLSISKLKEIKDNKLVIEVGYKFHKQRIESVGSRRIVKPILELYDPGLTMIECVVNPDIIEKVQENTTKDSNEDIVEEIFNDL